MWLSPERDDRGSRRSRAISFSAIDPCNENSSPRRGAATTRCRVRSLRALAGTLTLAALLVEGLAGAQELRLTRLSAEGLPASDVAAPGSEDETADWAGVQVTPDGRSIVYPHDDRVDGIFELYAASRDGATRVRLSPDLAPGESIRWFSLTPDGASVISLRGFAATGTWALYRVPITGPGRAEEQIHREADPGRTVARLPLAISPDSRWLVFGTGPSNALWGEVVLAARLDESPVTAKPVYPTPEWSQPVRAAFVSPDSSRLVLFADHLFGVPLPGGPADLVRLDEGDADGIGTPARATITADSTRVLFVVDDSQPGGASLFTVPIAGPGAAAVRMSPPGTEAGSVGTYAVSDDSQVVTYRWTPANYAPAQAWAVPAAGSFADAIRLDVAAMGPFGAGTPLPTVDSARAVFSLDPNGEGERQYVKVPILGPGEAAVPVTPLHGPWATFTGMSFSRDGRHIVYGVALGVVPPDHQFHTVPLAGPPELSRALGEPFTDLHQQAWPLVDPGSRSVALIADFEAPGRYEIVRALLDRPDLPVEPVHPELPPEATAQNEMLWTPDGFGLIFRADLTTAGKVELFIADALIFEDGLESGDASRWSVASSR